MSSGGAGLPFGPVITAEPAGPPAYWVTFYERDTPGNRITARLGEAPPTPTGGGGGWEQVQLPKRASVTIWRGRQDLTAMDVPIILGHPAGPPVGAEHNALHSMFRPPDPRTEPPVIKLVAGDAVPHQYFDWVITALTWGDAIGGANANRVMQKMTVSLLEHRPDETLQNARAAKPKHRGRSYTVRAGDTLSGIAARFKVKGGWRALAEAQHPPIHDPRTLAVGRHLLIP